jgi:hypothetical protein
MRCKKYIEIIIKPPTIMTCQNNLETATNLWKVNIKKHISQILKEKVKALNLKNIKIIANYKIKEEWDNRILLWILINKILMNIKLNLMFRSICINLNVEQDLILVGKIKNDKNILYIHI